MRIAILLRGVSYDPNYRHRSGWNHFVDYKDCLSSYHKYVFELFLLRGNVDVFLTTYDSDMKDEIIKDYNAKFYKFIPKENSNQRQTFLNG